MVGMHCAWRLEVPQSMPCRTALPTGEDFRLARMFLVIHVGENLAPNLGFTQCMFTQF